MKYIDADRLRAEIEEWYNAYIIGPHGAFRNGKIEALRETIELIGSLLQEQPEVDLEKEYTEFVVADPVYSKLVNGIVGKAIARHFYELGLKARSK